MDTLFLLLNKCICNYSCIFCSRGEKKYRLNLQNEIRNFNYRKESIKIQDIIYESSKTGKNNLIIGSNEPLNHPNIIKIIEFAKRFGFKKIILETEGIKFASSEYLQKIIQAGVDSISMPIYGINKDTHDYIVQYTGAYDLLHEAISNIEKTSAELNLHTVILKQNIHEVAEIKKKYRAKLFYPHQKVNNPEDYKNIAPAFSSISADIIKHIDDLNIPCVTGYSNMKEKIFYYRKNPNSDDSRNNERENRVKPESCNSCFYISECDGVYPEYLKIYGSKEFIPIMQ